MKDITEKQGQILDQILDEREAQDKQWGGPDHDDEHDAFAWEDIIHEHVRKLTVHKTATSFKQARDYRERLIKIAALAMAAVESHDRRTS